MPGVYPAGRLDSDSEGLVVLTADGALQARIADPRHKLPKTYWVQVEGVPDAGQIEALERGVVLPDGPTRPARVRAIDPRRGCGRAIRRSACDGRFRPHGWRSRCARAGIGRSGE